MEMVLFSPAHIHIVCHLCWASGVATNSPPQVLYMSISHSRWRALWDVILLPNQSPAHIRWWAGLHSLGHNATTFPCVLISQFLCLRIKLSTQASFISSCSHLIESPVLPQPYKHSTSGLLVGCQRLDATGWLADPHPLGG